MNDQKLDNVATRSIFDPGHPEFVECPAGSPRIAVLVMWYFYNIISVIILLNLVTIE